MSITNGRRPVMSLLHHLHLHKLAHGLVLPPPRRIIGTPSILLGTGLT